jgi:hypothetical protein
LIALGLLLTPVECALAAGPHSIFVAAASLANLQSGSGDVRQPHASPQHGHGRHHGRQRAGHGGRNPHQAAEPPAPAAPSSPDQDDAGARAVERVSPPRTAGFAAEPLGTFVVAEIVRTAVDRGDAAPGFAAALDPPGRLLPGPEPPPP